MSHGKSRFRSHLKNVRGLGAAHSGTEHFWLQRTSALALIPLSVWFMAKLMGMLVGADRAVVAEWFKDPVVAILMGVFLVALFTHARLGMQVIIEDYVHNETRKMLLLAINNGIKPLLCLACLFAIARLHFIGM